MGIAFSLREGRMSRWARRSGPLRCLSTGFLVCGFLSSSLFPPLPFSPPSFLSFFDYLLSTLMLLIDVKSCCFFLFVAFFFALSSLLSFSFHPIFRLIVDGTPDTKRLKLDPTSEVAAVAKRTDSSSSSSSSSVATVSSPTTIPPSPNTLSSVSSSSLQDELSCSCCLDLLFEPVALVCGHTFCSSCLADWTVIHNTCPYCSKQVTSEPCRVLVLEYAIEELMRSLPKEVPG